MSVSIKYKGAEIASASTEVTKTIKTAGKYCEADILVENTPDSGADPVINPLSVTENGTYTAPSGVDGYSPVTVNVPQGITPTGNINITDTNVTDVTNYATAQVVDADLVASNIKKDVNILGIIGTFEGGGGTEITDGIVVKARDANGYATEIDFYGTVIPPYGLGRSNNSVDYLRYVTNVNFKNTVTKIQNCAFSRSYITGEFVMPSVTSVEGNGTFMYSDFSKIELENAVFQNTQQACQGCANLISVKLPKINGLGASIFNGCTSLLYAEIGSIGHPIGGVGSYVFRDCTRVGLTVTAYCKGNYADTLLTGIRNGATNATIIIKASEATTYGGTAYAAGETMITSEVA